VWLAPLLLASAAAPARACSLCAPAVALAPPDGEAPRAFRFAVMSDVQEAIDRVQDVYRRIKREPDLDFLLGAGDLTEHGSAEELERFQTELRGLDIPYYTTFGKHELRESPSLFQPYFGRCNQSFEWRGVRFTLLDSASATIDPLAYDWLEDWLTLGAGGLHVVAMHVPPRDPYGLRELAFADRNEAVQRVSWRSNSGSESLGLLAETVLQHILCSHLSDCRRTSTPRGARVTPRVRACCTRRAHEPPAEHSSQKRLSLC
jgi:hypothetical protein